jgi:hypothetical protein
MKNEPSFYPESEIFQIGNGSKKHYNKYSNYKSYPFEKFVFTKPREKTFCYEKSGHQPYNDCLGDHGRACFRPGIWQALINAKSAIEAMPGVRVFLTMPLNSRKKG